MVSLSVLLILGALPAVLTMPRECVEGKNVSEFPVKCCPKFNGSECGADLNRGNCMLVPKSRSELPPDAINDFRMDYPNRFCNPRCVCKGNFSGYACEECVLGITGDNCDKIHKVTRKNFTAMSEAERVSIMADVFRCQHVIDPVNVCITMPDRDRTRSIEIKNCSYYHFIAQLHYCAVQPTYVNATEQSMNPNLAHGNDGFCPWHRIFLLYFDRSMQKCTKNPNWTTPYWCWELDPGFVLGTIDYLCSNDKNGNLHPWCAFSHTRMWCAGYPYAKSYCMTPDNVCERPTINRRYDFRYGLNRPTKAQVDRCVASPRYSTMNSCIEGLHNVIHMLMGGSMQYTSLAANDFLFMMHHCNVDRQCDRGIVKNNFTHLNYPNNSVYGHDYNSCAGCFYHCYLLRNYINPASTQGVHYDPPCNASTC